MLYTSSWLKKTSGTLLLLAIGTLAFAQEAKTTTVESETNLLAVLLIITAAVLAFVIWGMGQVLVALTRQMLDKEKRDRPIATTLLVVAGVASASVASAQTTTDVVVKTVPNYGGLSANTFYMLVSVIGLEIIIILFLSFFVRKIFVELLPEKAAAVARESKLLTWWAKMDKKVFTKAIPIEREADMMLDHDYDGIKELDNSLPPWWKYGFYITIGVAVVYLLNFHVFANGKNPTEEYAAEMENARLEQEQYEARNKDKVDEAHVPMADATGIATGKELYNANCVACHGDAGQGNVGPNLTDDYWLHKGSLNDIFQTIKNGYPNKGMAAWSGKFNPKEMSYIASYIKTLRGSNPAGAKVPQGELFVDSTTNAPMDTAMKVNLIDTLKKKTEAPAKSTIAAIQQP